MSEKAVTNIPASIRQRLANKAKESKRPFEETLQYFAMERFLYRLSQTTHSDAFILKGALLFRVWDTPDTRATKDIDFLANMENTPEAIALVVKDVCEIDDSQDGLVFDVDSIQATTIKEDADYEGVRVKFRCTLDSARIAMQIDVGFGDTVIPEAQNAEYPTLLDLPTATLRIYPPETVVAEKIEAMNHLGVLNSRMKDFYDVWRMTRQFKFDAKPLSDAVRATFKNRKTEIIRFNELSDELIEEIDRFQIQWTAFLDKNQVDGPQEYADVLVGIADLLSPILVGIIDGKEFAGTWDPAGSWK